MEFGPIAAELGSTSTEVRLISANLPGFAQGLGEVGRIWPDVGQLLSTSCQARSMSPKFGSIWASIEETLSISGQIFRNRANFGQRRPHLVECGPNSAEIEPQSAEEAFFDELVDDAAHHVLHRQS